MPKLRSLLDKIRTPFMLPTEARSLDDDLGRLWGPVGGRLRHVDERTAMTMSAVWACQTLIADAVATLPVDTYRKKSDGTREETTKPNWLERPNPENNRLDYDTQRMLSLLGWGNAYSLLVRQGGSLDPFMPVLERWCLSPHSVHVRRPKPTDVTSELEYYVFGERVPITNIQHIRGYTPPGWFLGMSPIAHMTQTLRIGLSAEEFSAAFYDKGMAASGVLSIPQLPADVTSAVVDKLRDQIIENNSGVANAQKPLVLTGGTTWSKTMVTPTDAQFLETRAFEKEEVCTWYRVPPHKIQHIVEHASQGGGKGIEQQSSEFAEDTLLNWTTRLETADSDLIPRGQFVKINLDAYVRTDLAARYAAYQQARFGGWYSANDVRAKEDLPPIENGDIYLQPVNYAEAGTQPTGLPVAMPQPEPNQAPGAPDGPQ